MTNQLQNIGIIGGSGWMGQAMVLQLIAKKAMGEHDLWISSRRDVSQTLADLPGVRVTKDNSELARHCDTVVLSVRPRDFPALQISLENHLVISVMAGVSVNQIQAHTAAKQIVRSMPNAAIEIGRSYTPWYATQEVSKAQLTALRQWFELFGAADQVQQENDINFFTALTGSGQGWVAFFEKCLIQCGIDYGLKTDLAEHAVRQLFLGMGDLLAQEKQPMNALVKELIDYAGTTAAGLKEMAGSAIEQDVTKAITASYQKAMSDMTK